MSFLSSIHSSRFLPIDVQDIIKVRGRSDAPAGRIWHIMALPV